MFPSEFTEEPPTAGVPSAFRGSHQRSQLPRKGRAMLWEHSCCGSTHAVSLVSVLVYFYTDSSLWLA